MKINQILFIVLFIFTISFSQDSGYSEEDGVIILDDKNFDQALEKFPLLLVKFYAPWCGHCKQLAPVYSEAAKELKNNDPPIILAQLNAESEKRIGSRFQIQGYPTIKYFKNKTPVEFTGNRQTKEDIMSWVKERTGDFTKELQSAEQLADLIAQNQDIFFVYFGDSISDAEFQIYRGQALVQNDLKFFHTFNTELRTPYVTVNTTLSHSVVLFKAFGNKRSDFSGKLNDKSFKQWVNKNSFPDFIPITERAFTAINDEQTNVLIAFVDDSDKGKEVFNSVSEIIPKNKAKIAFAYLKPDMEKFQKLSEEFGIKAENLPLIFILGFQGGFTKYKFEEGEVNGKNLEKFISQFRIRRLKRYLKSQDPPATQGDVQVIVGSTFEDLVLKSKKDVLVKFYAPWCGHCKELAPKYESAAKKLSIVNPNLVLAELDLTANEVPSVHIQGYPTLFFYPNGKKSKAVKYEGERTEQGIIDWLKKQVTYQWVEPKTEL